MTIIVISFFVAHEPGIFYFFQDLFELFYATKCFKIQFVCFPGEVVNFKWREVIFLEN